MEDVVNEIVNEIVEYLRRFYKWPAIYVVGLYEVGGVKYGYVDVLSRASGWWYKYGEPIGNPSFALMYEGVWEIPEEPVELRLVEVALWHLESREVVFSFLGDVEDQHVYEARPLGSAVKVYAARTENGDVVFTDTSQLRRFVETRLR
jgi:hypothetical protein